MKTIRRLTKKDMYPFAVIGAGAYAGMKASSDDDIKRLADRLWATEREDPGISLYGLFRDGRLVGGMRLFDFSMKMHSTYLPVGGVGFIAVDLAHKKEHVCKDLVEYYIDYYARKKAPMLVLYPFRPDFYRKMGFGYGTKVNEYRIRPADLPSSGDRRKVVLATKSDFAALNDCYHRVVDKTHGMIKRTKTYMNYHSRPGTKFAVYRNGKKIEGFLIFSLVPVDDKNWLVTELRAAEFIFETREAMLGLLAFVNSQADQVRTCVLKLQDDDFHFVPRDPRNDSGRLINPVAHEANTSGIGIMYRVIDTPGVFRALKKHDFNGVSCKLKITVRDNFYPKHNGSYVIHFVNGKPQVKTGDDHEVEITMDVADYSSMVMGVVPFAKLCDYGLADISKKTYIETVTRIFTPLQKPYCITQF